jgi:hypothetical protein
MKLGSAIAGWVLLGSMSMAQASPVDVSFTVSGSAGNWLYNFSVTNNLLPANEIYSLGVQLNTTNRVGAPAGWDPGIVGVNWAAYGGANVSYNNTWVTCRTATCPINFVDPEADINPGETTSGFQVLDNGVTPLASVQWYVTSYGNSPVYPGPGCSFICNAPGDNPGFQGIASASVVPVPAAVWLFGSALGVMGVMRRKISS